MKEPGMTKKFLVFIFILVAVGASACGPAKFATPAPTMMSSTSISGYTETDTPPAMPCIVLHIPVTPVDIGASFEGRSHILGQANASVAIIIFSDYQCPACAYLERNLKQVRLAHPNDVRFIFVTTPFSDHDKDTLAMQAAEAADIQGKYWEMHDLLFEQQDGWINLDPGVFEEWAIQQASNLGMEEGQFRADFEGNTVQERVQQALQSSAKQAITPPVFFINSSSPYTGLVDFSNLDQVIRMEILTARQFNLCPDWLTVSSKQYIATLHTAKGDVTIQLFPDKAPLAVNNFVFLARSGWYDGISFYRVISSQIVETGDPSETGMGNPGYLFATEISTGLSFDKAGMVAMENSGVNTNGSRFFITLAPQSQMEGQYTIFGQVISGMDVVKALSARDPVPGSSLPPGDELINLTIEEH
jgi:cyclophilin family peptidyl-prolyl cis-trans isomerase/predicted DsbA family dithiol-disulfide isomerase